MTPFTIQKYDLEVVKGDTINENWKCTSNGVDFDFSNYTAKLVIRKNRKIIHTFSTTPNQGITLTLGNIHIFHKNCHWAYGEYDYSFELTDNLNKTYNRIGGIFRILEMSKTRYNLDVVRYDRFNRSFTFFKDGLPFDFTGYDDDLWIYDKNFKTVRHFNNAATILGNTATIDMSSFDLPAFEYFYNLSFKDGQGTVYTLVSGRFLVVDDINSLQTIANSNTYQISNVPSTLNNSTTLAIKLNENDTEIIVAPSTTVNVDVTVSDLLTTVMGLPMGVMSQVPIFASSKGTYTFSAVGKITGWRLVSDTNCTATLDVWKKADSIPTNADSIFTTKPSLSNSSYNKADGLNIDVLDLDVFVLEVESNDNAKYLRLELIIKI